MRRRSRSLRRRALAALGISMSAAGVALGALAGYADRGAPAPVPSWSHAPLVAATIVLLMVGVGMGVVLGVARPRHP